MESKGVRELRISSRDGSVGWNEAFLPRLSTSLSPSASEQCRSSSAHMVITFQMTPSWGCRLHEIFTLTTVCINICQRSSSQLLTCVRLGVFTSADGMMWHNTWQRVSLIASTAVTRLLSTGVDTACWYEQQPSNKQETDELFQVWRLVIVPNHILH